MRTYLCNKQRVDCHPVLNDHANNVGQLTCAKPADDFSSDDDTRVTGSNKLYSLLVGTGQRPRMAVNTLKQSGQNFNILCFGGCLSQSCRTKTGISDGSGINGNGT